MMPELFGVLAEKFKDMAPLNARDVNHKLINDYDIVITTKKGMKWKGWPLIPFKFHVIDSVGWVIAIVGPDGGEILAKAKVSEDKLIKDLGGEAE